MKWNRSSAIGMAKATCATCNGWGMIESRNQEESPCHCVLRSVFRQCYNKFRQCALLADQTGNVTLNFCKGFEGRRSFGRKREEFAADFCLVSQRVLEPEEYRIFRFHFLLGADWRLCCDRLKMDRGNFFHEIYRIEQKLGEAYSELEPYALFPLEHYFETVIRESTDPRWMRLPKAA